MYFDRAIAKRKALGLLKTAKPSPLLMTLVYLLLTTGLAQAMGSVLTNPFTEVMYYIRNNYSPLEACINAFGGSSAMLGIFVYTLLMYYMDIMAYGYAGYTLRLSRGERGSFGNLIDGFNLVVKVVYLNLLTTLFIFLWGMLFIIPGIIAAYRYSMAVYCLLDDPEISSMEALRRSKTLMKGREADLFALHISFIGWFFLSVALSNIVMYLLELSGVKFILAYWAAFVVNSVFNLWLGPYMNIVMASFYNNLIGYTLPVDTNYRGPKLEF